MDADARRAARLMQSDAHRRDPSANLGRQAAAVRVAQYHPAGARPRRLQANLDRVFGIACEAVEKVLGVEYDLTTRGDAVCYRLAHHREVFIGRRLQHGAHLPRVALAYQRPGRGFASCECRQVGVILAGATGPPGGAERGQP